MFPMTENVSMIGPFLKEIIIRHANILIITILTILSTFKIYF